MESPLTMYVCMYVRMYVGENTRIPTYFPGHRTKCIDTRQHTFLQYMYMYNEKL